MKAQIIFLWLVGVVKIQAQDFSIATIPAELRESAHAVVRSHETQFIIKNAGQAVTKVKGTISILDEKGDTHALLYLAYDKFTKINDLEARVYDANGKQLKKLKKADIENINTSGSGIGDSFVKVASIAYPVYPYTVSYSYEYTTKNMMFYPAWEAIADNAEGTSVEQASFVVSVPSNLKLRYKEQKIPANALQVVTGEPTLYTWKVTNLKALKRTDYSPSPQEEMPTVFTGPTDFEVDDYSGKLNSWTDVGRFYAMLNKDRDALPKELIDKIKNLTQAEPTEIGKIRKVYEYVQANTRYVSIQLGIGGWQSIKAEEVAEKGYGDCKALTNFTIALLKQVGIKAYPALVKAGDEAPDIPVDFPSFQFNHVIACVPLAKDTVWLECTSQHDPVGYLGSFTDARHVILAMDNSGAIVTTPTYSHTDNQQIRKATILLNENAEATAEVQTTYSGQQQETISEVVRSLSNEDQKKWLNNRLTLASFEVKQFSFREQGNNVPSVTEKLQILLRNAFTKSGTRLFLTPNLFNKAVNVPLPDLNRKVDFEMPYNYLDVDSLVFRLPKGYQPEYLPEPVVMKAQFGSYQSSVTLQGDMLIYWRRVTMNKGRYAPALFNEWVDYRKKIVKIDKNQAVLVFKL
ncbi:MAG: DUF3857 domain-containing protein [Spirosomataceae bacterium]